MQKIIKLLLTIKLFSDSYFKGKVMPRNTHQWLSKFTTRYVKLFLTETFNNWHCIKHF